MIYFESSRFQTIIDPQLPLSSFPPYLCPQRPVFDWAEANVSIYTTWLRPSHNRRGSEVPLLRKYLLGRAGAATRKQLHSLGEDAKADRRLWRLRRRQAVLSQSNTPTISIQTTLGPIFLHQLPQSALQLRRIGTPIKRTVLLEHVQRHLETFLMAVAAVPFKSALETQPNTLQQSKLKSISTLLLVRLNVFCVKILLEFLLPVQTHPSIQILPTYFRISAYLQQSPENIVKSKIP